MHSNDDLLETLDDLERETLQLDPTLRRRFLRLRKLLEARARETARLQTNLKRHQQLLEHSLTLAGSSGAGSVGLEALDVLIGLAGAQRGFVGLCEGAGWRLLAARSVTEADLADPASQVSTGIIEAALARREPVLSDDA